MRARRRVVAALVVLLVFVAGGYVAAPYARALSLLLRVANMGGPLHSVAVSSTHTITVSPPHTVPTRYGNVAAQFYTPDSFRRTVLLIPGIHSMGIDEPRLTSFARQLSATGVNVMTMALPDLQAYRISPHATDTIEDAVLWAADQPRLAPDGRVGIVAISFAGGLSISAASRTSIHDKLAFVVSSGGHADLPRVMRYLATGVEPDVAGVTTHPPHDYGVAVILYGLADRGVVPAEQVTALRDGIRMFLLASQQAMVDKTVSERTFAQARAFEAGLPEPSRTYMKYVNDRATAKLGPMLIPHLDQLGANDPALSPDRVDTAPTAPIFLMHGDDDNVIPAAESALLAEYLRQKQADVHLLLTRVVTHAQVNSAEVTTAATEAARMVSFWASILRR
jgi:dienelactone hydrolase